MLEDVAFLFAPTMRSRSYAQLMRAHDLMPKIGLALGGEDAAWDGPQTVRTGIDPFVFRPGETARETLGAATATIVETGESDINSTAIVEAVSRLGPSIIIFSGPSGALLREPILATGKKFLHVHGGVAPHYRGSTAFYYSLLREGTIGATALFLDNGIDTGPILRHKTYVPESGVDIDRILDPLIRGSLLVDVLGDISRGKILQTSTGNEDGTTYHVIHPILKHLALRKVAGG